MSMSWNGFKDEHTGIAKLEWCVDLCTKASCSDFNTIQGIKTSIVLTQAEYKFGSKMVADKFYCATIRATNGAGLQASAKSSKSAYTKNLAQPGTVSDGADANRDPGFQRDTTKLSACWSEFPAASDKFTVRPICVIYRAFIYKPLHVAHDQVY